MNLNYLLLAEAAPAPATGATSTGAPATPEGAGEAPPAGSNMTSLLVMFGLTFAVMYFFMIRPQQKKERALRDMVSKIKKNDKIVLTGGIFGVVAQVRDKDVIIKIDEKNDVRIRVLKSSVIAVEGKGDGDGKASKEEVVEEKDAKEETSGAGA